VPRRFGYDLCLHHSDRFSRRHGFSAGESYTRFEPSHLDDSRFLDHDSHPTGSNGEV
jgi:hypothetical protein